jgi:hypothetical protein
VARYAIASVSDLDRGLILAPERYDPARDSLARSERTVGDVALIVRAQISRKTADSSARYLVLDTGDAREGVVVSRKEAVEPGGLRSAKKVVEQGDVIISRLRPYLRQVAFIDAELCDRAEHVVCSTEFYVLRAKGSGSLAFLVPWLLSDPVQAVLAAAQEGGHHPRFSSDVLRDLPIPDALYSARRVNSDSMENAVRLQRQTERAMRDLVEVAASTSA